MLTRPVRAASLSLMFAAVSLLASAACEKVPLLAPTGSTITLNVPTNVLSANGVVDIIATVLESGGTPPHSGTEVTFTTNLGTIQPATVITDTSGRAMAKFLAGASNGTATITATSGAATTGTAGAVKIALGTAAVGHVTLSANPSTISSNGGVSAILANVLDLNANALTSAAVSFSTSAGTLGTSLVSTDVNGNAATTLTTSVQATVTATVGVPSTSGGGTTTGGTTTPAAGSTTGQATATVTVNVSPLPTVTITAPAGTITAGSPVTFTFSASPGTNSTAQIRDVTVNFGDGSGTIDLGAISGTGLTVQHSFPDVGAGATYIVRITVLDTLGATTSGATVVVVQPQPPLTLSISKASTPSGPNTIYTFTATVTPSSTTVVNYQWTVDSGAPVQNNGNNQLVQTFPTSAVHQIFVTATTSTGATVNGTVVVP